MNINNSYWWLLILLNFASYFTYSYGQIIGKSKVIQFVGGAFFILSFVAMFIFFGLWSGIILMLLAFALVAPIVGLLIARTEKNNERIKSARHAVEAQKLLKALNKGMVKEHMKHKDEHPELQAYSSFEDWLKAKYPEEN